MALKRNTEVDNRWYVVALDDGAPLKIIVGDWTEAEASEWASKELEQFIVCRFRDFSLTVTEPNIKTKRRNETLDNMGDCTVKLLRKMMAMHDEYSRQCDLSIGNRHIKETGQLMKQIGTMLQCFWEANKIFAPDMDKDAFLDLFKEQSE